MLNSVAFNPNSFIYTDDKILPPMVPLHCTRSTGWRAIRRRIPRALAGGYPWMIVHEEMEGEGLLAGIQADRIMSQGECRLPEDAWV